MTATVPTTPNAQVRALVYCTFCGNRSMKNLASGQKLDLIFRLRRCDVPKLVFEFFHSRCAYCGERMGVQILDDAPPTPRCAF